jgi:hypothetical protein
MESSQTFVLKDQSITSGWGAVWRHLYLGLEGSRWHPFFAFQKMKKESVMKTLPTCGVPPEEDPQSVHLVAVIMVETAWEAWVVADAVVS